MVVSSVPRREERRVGVAIWSISLMLKGYSEKFIFFEVFEGELKQSLSFYFYNNFCMSS